MREILFRGIPMGARDPEDPTFVYGWLECDAEMHRTMIHFMEDHKEMLVEVGPRTVGQYTGLTDKNGKKIFEGDIVLVHNPTFGDYYCRCLEYRFAWDLEEPGCSPDCLSIFDPDTLEVAGNVYDNPELLEVP